MQDYSDIELVHGVLRGNAHCEEALYRRFSVPMFRVCLRYAANRTEAEDMLQEGFMRVFADLKDYRGEGSLEGWIRRVIVRAALRWLHKRRLFDYADLEPEALGFEPEDTSSDLLPADDGKLIAQSMQQLPPGYRTVLNLFAIEGYSHEEIAGLLQISAGTSRSQLSKARTLLKKMLEQHGAVAEKPYPITGVLKNI